MKVMFERRELIAEDTYTFWFSKPEGMHYTAGKFIEIYLPDDKPDSRGVRRWFTLSSSPTEKMLSITTKMNTKSSSFKKKLMNLQPEAEIDMADPMGDFVLPKDASIPLLFIASGIGCTPFRSMIKWLQDTNGQRDIKLIYASSSAAQIAFTNIFDKLGNNFRKLTGNPLTYQNIYELVPDIKNRYVYLSGPEPMVERLQNEIISSGYDKRTVYTDFFHGYTN
jgi:glycine betaine catabolism B